MEDTLLNKISGKWCIIMHGHDSYGTVWDWNAFGFEGKLLVNYNRLFFPTTQFFHDERIAWLKEYSLPKEKDNYTFFTSTNTKVHPIGYPVYDNKLAEINSDMTRKKYGIPAGKEVLIYLPFAFLPSRSGYGDKGSYSWQAAFSGVHVGILRNITQYAGFKKLTYLLFSLLKKSIYYFKVLIDSEARTWLLNGWHEPAVIQSIRTFCDNNNLLLVVKPKPNFPIAEEVYKCADMFISDDESQKYPSKLQELISVSRVVLGYHTTASSETVFGGAYHINLECPISLWGNNKARWQNHHVEEGGRNNFSGIVTNMKISEFLKKFAKMSLQDFCINIEAKKSYLDKFLGNGNPTAAEKFCDVLEDSLYTK